MLMLATLRKLSVEINSIVSNNDEIIGDFLVFDSLRPLDTGLFGTPRQLKQNIARLTKVINNAVEKIAAEGSKEDLPIQDAALKDLVSPIISLELLIKMARSFQRSIERLLQELIDYGVTNDTEWTPDLANSLPFLGILIKEVQRKHNPSYQPGRTALADVILPGGYRIPKDSVMIISIPHIHNDPTIWDDPAKSDPDRWNTDKAKNRHKAAYVPFAAGPRMCIGFNFALEEVRVIISMLIYRYQFEKVGQDPVDYDPAFQLIRPVNFYVRAKKRTSWPGKSKGVMT
ncbi:cytochrome P450 [Mollisia scopiformis]|uniref:Cytochrome P450 n=1 Tax=Mollisia scopiformis TaxID=149040 RepID=A0A132B8X3_MOLSC|nr:cytochrome P450 [Mollisia scopiformis]KUJ08821.1 cytochrome P450 [Mollisia scopiformis]